MGKGKPNYNKMTDEEILDLFKEQYYKIKPKDVVEFYNKSKNTPSPYILKKRLNLTYGEILVQMGIREDVYKHYTKDPNHKEDYYNKYKNKIFEIYNKLGYIPNSNEIQKYGLYTCNIKRVLGLNYNEFVSSIGFKEDDIKYEKYRPHIPKENKKLLEMYRELCFKLGRIATRDDVNEYKKMPSSTTLINIFGSFNELKRLSKVDESALDKRLYTKSYILENLKQMYIDYSRRLNREEIKKEVNNYFERGISVETIFIYFKTRNINDIWIEVEKSLIQDYIKLLKKNKSK